MFDTTHALASDLMAPIRSRLVEVSPDETCEAEALDEMGRDLGSMGHELADECVGDQLKELGQFITGQLPWVSKATGEPVGMWVESVGRVDNCFEPFQIGTPYVWVAVASWEAAEAVYEALASTARIDEARWVGGWQDCNHGLRKIKIYPLFPERD